MSSSTPSCDAPLDGLMTPLDNAAHLETAIAESIRAEEVGLHICVSQYVARSMSWRYRAVGCRSGSSDRSEACRSTLGKASKIHSPATDDQRANSDAPPTAKLEQTASLVSIGVDRWRPVPRRPSLTTRPGDIRLRPRGGPGRICC